MESIQKLKEAFNPIIPLKGFLHYYTDFEHKIYEEVMLNEIPQTIEFDSGEAIILKSAAEVKDGKPVYKVGRGYPISIDLIPDKDRNAIIEETMSSFRLKAWLNDVHITHLTKPKRSDFNPIYSAFFAVLSSVFITLFITYVLWGA